MRGAAVFDGDDVVTVVFDVFETFGVEFGDDEFPPLVSSSNFGHEQPRIIKKRTAIVRFNEFFIFPPMIASIRLATSKPLACNILD